MPAATADSRHSWLVAENKLARQFDINVPNTVWCGDITAIWTLGGWLYLVAVMDLADRQCVGWALAGHRVARLATDALKMPIGRRRPTEDIILYYHRKHRLSRYLRLIDLLVLHDTKTNLDKFTHGGTHGLHGRFALAA